MRGNEEKGLTEKLPDLVEFSIPMRGNEQDEMRSVAQTIDGSSRSSWFPIPVRG